MKYILMITFACLIFATHLWVLDKADRCEQRGGKLVLSAVWGFECAKVVP